MDHHAEAERLLQLCSWNETTALGHALLALIEKLDELPFIVVSEEEEDEE